jgi:hypothetical protein
MQFLFRAFPLMAIPMAIYFIFALPLGHDAMAAGLAAKLFSLRMLDGAEWVVSRGQGLTILALLCLFIEIVKSALPKPSSMVENGLSAFVFVIGLVLFLLAPPFATAEFFILVLMTLLDFIAGFTVMTYTSRRTVEYH